MLYEMIQKGPTVWVPFILVSLLITLVAYGIFPLVFAFTRKHPVTKKKYRRSCYIVNAVIMLFFIIGNKSTNSYPYLLWTEVFVQMGLKMLQKKSFIVNNEACVYLPRDVNVASNCNDHCSACGALLTPESAMCNNCGAQIEQVAEPKMKHIKTKEGFVDNYGWAAEIAELSTDEIYCRYHNKEEWSKDYRALCYQELVKRQEVST